MLKILICGATGFIGRNLVNYFSSNPNYQIFAVHNNRKPYDVKNAANKITWIKADLRKSDDVFKVVNSMDIIIQAAATTSGAKDIVSKPYIHVTDNALMNSLLLRQAMESNVKHFIFFSCSVMYQSNEKALKESDWDPTKEINSKYFGVANTKIYIEKMLEFYSKISNMKTTAIRHSNIYGPFDKYDLEKSHVFGATITKVMTAKNEIIVWGSGHEKRDVLHVDDLMNFVKLCINNQTKKFQLYNCGSGESISIKSLVSLIIEKSGKDIKIKHDLTKPSIKTNFCLDCSLAKKELNWTPIIKLSEGISKTITWWSDNIDPKKI